ncbi:MAG: thioredoxin domain-containing protein [Verrucomicrobia bacterium]|nr:thioredoxin domain-containing protein [Verrucomicrobiota bacterium]
MILFRAKTISLILVGSGLIISVYLLWGHIVLTGTWPNLGVDVCSALFGVGCDAALRSPASSQFGLPLAGWGLIYYGTLATLLFLARFLGETFEFEAHFATLLLALLAFFLTLALAGIMLTGKAPFCPLCALVHLINLALVFSLKRLTDRSIAQLFQALSAVGKYLLSGKTADPTQARWKLLGFFTTGLVAAVLYQWVLIESLPRAVLNNGALNPQQVLAEFEASTEQVIPVDADDPTLGPANAPVQIVVFSDFQCPACRGYARELYTLVEQYAKKIQVVFKHFPLDKTCNPIMKRDLHPNACEAAYAAVAAHKQGRFWPFHNKLFETDLYEDANTFTSLAEASGLDVQRFEADYLAEATKEKVLADIELAVRLAVDSTPTLFLNLRRVSDTRPKVVRILIDNVLQKMPR